MAKRDSYLVIRRSATGLGLFTLRDIPPGKRIIEYAGPVVTAEEVARCRGRWCMGQSWHTSRPDKTEGRDSARPSPPYVPD